MNTNQLPRKSVNTFSIVGFDPATGELGVAVASKFLAAGALVPYAKAGVGAVATQSWVNSDYGPMGLQLMEQGLSAQEALQRVTEEDENREVRQVGFVDARGGSATFTGDECYAWAGGIAGPNFAAQGNILVDEKTVHAMAHAFQHTPGDLGTRLLQALLAGEEAGGDSRGKQAAGLLVVKEKGGYGGYNDRYIDLRVDEHKEPVRELIRIYHLHQLYFKPTEKQDVLKIEGELQAKLFDHLTALNYIKDSSNITEENLLNALQSFHSIENFEERLQERGYIDRKVVEYMEGLLTRED